MARTFAGGTNFLSRGTGAIPTNVTTYTSGPPVSFACWMNATSFPGGGCSPLGVTQTSVANMLDLQLNGSKIINAESGASSVYVVAADTLTMVAGTWYHICAVYASITDRRIFRDGVKHTNATSNNCGTLVRAWMACSPNGTNAFLGTIAFPAAWSVALNDDEVTALSQGIHPRKIRSSSLVMCCNLTGSLSPEPDLCYSVGWQVSGTPTEATNPRIYL